MAAAFNATLTVHVRDSNGMTMRTCERTHPWINFELDPGSLDASICALLDETGAKCSRIKDTALGPATTRELELVSLVRAVHASAAIEGNPLSEAQVRKRLTDRLYLPRAQEPYGQEAANIAAALEKMTSARAGGDALLCVRDILNANEWLLRDLPLDVGVLPGKLRAPGQHVRVGGYLGAPPEDLAYLLQRLCDWLNAGLQSSRTDDRPAFGILKAILTHVYIAWIHPFADGNGRTARLLESHLLHQAGLPQSAAFLLSPHYHCTRPEYYSRLERSSQCTEGLIDFLRYALQGLVDGLDEWLRVLERLSPDGPRGWDERGLHPQRIAIEVEHARRVAAGAFENPVSLANRYAKPGVGYSDEELRQTLREIRTEWEAELDELLADD